jgi:hypothetical protein
LQIVTSELYPNSGPMDFASKQGRGSVNGNQTSAGVVLWRADRKTAIPFR